MLSAFAFCFVIFYSSIEDKRGRGFGFGGEERRTEAHARNLALHASSVWTSAVFLAV